MKNRNVLIILGILAFIILIGGISYSYFVYNSELEDVSIEAGEISLNYSDVSGNMSLSGVIPLSDNIGKSSSDYIDFTIDGVVTTSKIYYEISIIPDSNNTLDSQYIKVYLTDQNDNVIQTVTSYDTLLFNEKETGKRLYRDTVEPNENGTQRTYSKDYRLRVWLDESYNEPTSKTFDFNINLYAKNVENDYEIPYGSVLVRNAMESKTGCTPSWTDNDDGIIYFSGNNTCIDFNYVWYSGKLWRITSIYPDGAMKLISETGVSTVSFNSNIGVEFYTDANTTSIMYQWLNEEFSDTLYNGFDLIDTTKLWNITNSNVPTENDALTMISNKLSNDDLIPSNIGLLNSFEYYNSYRCFGSNDCTSLSYANSYLNINYYWYLINPCSSTHTWFVTPSGKGVGVGYYQSLPRTVRPAIILKPKVEFTGNGTQLNPYKIVGDKYTGSANELINTRLSGEYVQLKNGNNEQLFRIIGVEEGKTKIIAMDYAASGANKPFATTNGTSNYMWGSGSTIGSNTWYTYLNDVYYVNLVNTYGNLFDSGLYYLGTSTYNYKLSVCANTTSGSTKVCDKTPNKDTFNIGLPRYGELFSNQQHGGDDNSISTWLITRYTANAVLFLSNSGYARGDANDSLPATEYGARPTLHLKSTVKIISGSGTESDPYVVGL